MRDIVQSAVAAAATAYLIRLAVVFFSTGLLRPVHIDTVLQPALLLWLAGLVVTAIFFALRGFRLSGWSGGIWTLAVVVFAVLDWFGLFSVPAVDLSL